MTGRIMGIITAVFMAFSGGLGYVAPDSDPNGFLILVNKQHKAPNLVPELVEANIDMASGVEPKYLMMQPEAAQAIERMFETIREEEGLELTGISGYRSYNTQKNIYERRVEERGESAKMTVAPPGHSEHQTGLAMDVGEKRARNTRLHANFGETEEGIWVAENAHRFGFILRYKKGWEDITGYSYEPWHIRYVGEEHAKAIYEADCTLEEYLEALQMARLMGLFPDTPENAQEVGGQ